MNSASIADRSCGVLIKVNIAKVKIAKRAIVASASRANPALSRSSILRTDLPYDASHSI
ncbi:MAG: hypothetical protein H7Z11_19665 [Verrucomicrobia bacterium]|nr:hypothetical protein [Leptolyngbya sp. ES-bin-22]